MGSLELSEAGVADGEEVELLPVDGEGAAELLLLGQ